MAPTATPDDPHRQSLEAWAAWTERGYHRSVVGPFHPRARRGAPHRLLNAAVIRAARRAAADGDRATLLDAGCGPGNLEAWLGRHRDRGALEVCGLDADGGALELAAAAARRSRLSFTAVRADLCDTAALGAALGDRRFDVVVAINSLLPAAAPGDEPRAPLHGELAALAAACAPDGCLVAVLPGWSRRLEEPVAPRGHHLGDNGDGVAHCLHTAATIREELPAAGWSVDVLEPYRYGADLGGAAPMDWVVLARPG